MADISKATPRPWRCVQPMALDYRAMLICSADGASLIGTMQGGGPHRAIDAVEERANAALVVKAVNERCELLSILRGCIDAFEAIGNMPVAYSRAVAMLAKADSDAR